MTMKTMCSVCCIAFCLLLMSPLSLHAADSSADGDACPQRGLEVPAKVHYERGGSIPGWEKVAGSVLHRGDGKTPTYSQEIVTDRKKACLVLESVRPDRSQMVLDSIDITRYYKQPGQTLERGYPWSQCSDSSVLRSDGSIDHEREDTIIGFVLPEKGRGDCTHYSRRIKGAWRIDYEAGRYVPVLNRQLVCEYQGAGGICYPCKLPKQGELCSRR